MNSLEEFSVGVSTNLSKEDTIQMIEDGKKKVKLSSLLTV